MGKFIYSDDNKRYHTWNFYLRHQFGCKVFKVSLDAGFTCPNLDGTKGWGGCTYCSSRGSGDFAGDPAHSVCAQFYEVKQALNKKWPQGKCIAYFQAHTNTYAPVQVLRERFEPVLNLEDVIGLSIATRADCLGEDVLDYLEELNRRTFLIVELGLQTIHEATARRINRCHSYEEFLTGLRRLRERRIRVCVHIINGLPGETHEMMLQTARALAGLDIQFVKIHLLHVLKGTVMAGQLERGEFSLLSLEEYVRIVCDQLEVFGPELVIQRVTGDGARDALIGPQWSLKKFVVMNAIDLELVRRDSCQSKYFIPGMGKNPCVAEESL